MRLPTLLAAVAVTAAAATLHPANARANPVTMVLSRASLDNDSDASGNGLWQYEGGVIEDATGTSTIGHYIATRRVTTSGTSSDNTAAETITLFFPSPTAGNVPNNITLEGAYSYNTGQFSGSVSATSLRYRPLNGVDATATVAGGASTTLSINVPGVEKVP